MPTTAPSTNEEAMERQTLTAREVERVYGLNTGTLGNWRSQGRGPAYTKAGRKVLYYKEDIEAFLQQGKRKTVQ